MTHNDDAVFNINRSARLSFVHNNDRMIENVNDDDENPNVYADRTMVDESE